MRTKIFPRAGIPNKSDLSNARNTGNKITILPPGREWRVAPRTRNTVTSLHVKRGEAQKLQTAPKLRQKPTGSTKTEIHPRPQPSHHEPTLHYGQHQPDTRLGSKRTEKAPKIQSGGNRTDRNETPKRVTQLRQYELNESIRSTIREVGTSKRTTKRRNTIHE